MNFVINDAEAERNKTIKFAKDNNIPLEEMEAVYNEIYESLPDDLSDNAKELKALRKTRGSLRRLANSNANYIDAFLFMRFRNSNFNEYAWKLVDEYVDTHGIEEAKEKGMVNDKGEYLHTSYTTQFSEQMGKVIDKKDARGFALGFFKIDDEIEARFATMGKFSVWDKFPLCREISANIKLADKPGKLLTDKNQVFLNGARYTTMSHYYSADDFQTYAGMIEDTCGDVLFSTKAEIDDYALDTNDPFNFAATYATVNRIGDPTDNGNVPIELEIDDDVITVWAEEYIFRDLTIEEGIVGLAMLNTNASDDTVYYRIGGFLPLSDD